MARVAAVAATTVALVAVVALLPTSGIVAAAPASLEASFRNLPVSVRAGDLLAVQVDVRSGVTCDGTITYRDGAAQPLASLSESGGRCRWDVTVPTDARRGTADIAVNVTKDVEPLAIQATVEVTRRSDDIDAAFHELPGTVRRGDGVSLRVDVDQGATCQGAIVYDDNRVQALAPLTEQKERCRWTVVVPADAVYGNARIGVIVTQGANKASLMASFEVGRKSSENDLPIGLKNLPASLRRDDAVAIRALVPTGAECTGSVSYLGVAPQVLEKQAEADGECRWSTRVPSDARAGNAEIAVTARQATKENAVVAVLPVDRTSSDVDAAFRDLPDSIRRGQTFDIRVNVPNNASCDGAITYSDDEVRPLGVQAEHKGRCHWEIEVPSSAARGAAVVRITLNDNGSIASLVRNVEVLGKNEVAKAAWAGDLPGSVKPGDAFDAKINAPAESTCSGTILFADGSQSALAKRDEEKAECRWRVTVPAGTGAGQARVEVSVLKDGRETKLSGSFDVGAS